MCRLLIYAIEKRQLDIVKSIIERDPSSINEKDPNTFNTPLFIAVLSGNLDIVEFLLNTGVDVDDAREEDCKEEKSWTPLFGTIMKCDIEMTKLLLSFGANVNSQDHFGRTYVHWAVVNHQLDIVELLLSFKANVDIRDQDGKTPLDLALDKDLVDIVKCLETHRDKLNSLDEHFNLGIWISDSELIKLLPDQLFNQVNVLAQLTSIDSIFLGSYSTIIYFPIELFHELLLELWGLSK